MKKLSRFIKGVVFFLVIAGTCYAAQQNDAFILDFSIDECQHYLMAEGFENIQFSITQNRSLWVTYENRVFRNEMTALGIVLRYITEYFPFLEHYIIVPRHKDIPLVHFRVRRDDFVGYMIDEISSQEFVKRIQLSYSMLDEHPIRGYRSKKVNSSVFKMDVQFAPGLRLQFARPNDPAQMQFNALGNISATILNGLSLNGQWIAPIYNEFQSWEGKQRVGYLYLNQFLRLPHIGFMSLSAGLFDNQIYGASGQVTRFMFDSRFALSLRMDYLDYGEHCFFNPYLGANPGNLKYVIMSQYNFQSVNFNTRLSWGVFSLGDRSWRLDLTRSFSELELGFMGIWNESQGFLTGMNVKIPFPVSRHPMPGRGRIHVPRSIRWSYRYLPQYHGYLTQSGVDICNVYDQFSRSFMIHNIGKIKSALKYVHLHHLKKIERYAKGGTYEKSD